MEGQTRIRSANLPAAHRLFLALVVASLMAGCAQSAAEVIPATGSATSLPEAVQAAQTAIPSLHPVDQGGPQPLPVDGSSFYYYAEGVRIQLTPSLSWIAVKFASDDLAEQSAALQGSIAGPLDQARRLPNPVLTLLPVRQGLTTQQLIEGINSLRANRSSFLQVNPVFQSGNAEMVLTDEFIAAFPTEKGKEEISALNSSHGVETVESVLGQENTFVLRVTTHAHLDALGMANLYQEEGLALYAAPNFLRITALG